MTNTDILRQAKEATEWPTVTEYSEEYAISRATIKRAVRDRQFGKVFRLGEWRIAPESFAEWLRNRQT